MISAPLWTYLYQQCLNKILNDAQLIAVSTADADSNARWAWWDNFKKIASDIFNAALLVLTPFVPGLGELMLAYTAYQLTNEVVEGALDLAQGHWTQVAEHVIGVVTDVIQLAAFGAGAVIGNEFRLQVSSFVESMRPVPSADGKTRLWHADLQPYAQADLTLPSTSKPDARGLYRHAGKHLLPLEGKHYELKYDRDSGRYRARHPDRPQTYAPQLRHNERGAWVHEGETPQDWQGPALMRRLGHSVDAYTDAELQTLRIISGTPEDSLRRMYVENSAPPPLLDDTLTRFKTWAETRNLSELIRTGQPLDAPAYWFERMVPDMPGWPADKALQVFEQVDLSGDYRQYGNPHASIEQTLAIGRADLLAGKLPERLVAFLDETEMRGLLGHDYPTDQQVQVLRSQLADTVETRTPDIFNYRYQLKDHMGDARVRLLQRQYPQLPSRVAEALVTKASPAEQQIMLADQRIPLRVKDQARESAFEVQAARACEGLYEPALQVPDTERLILNALRLHTDAFADLRIEVREQFADGTLRCSVGSEDAATISILVRDERGAYAVHDDKGQQRHAPGDLFEAVLLTLPAEERANLGYRPGQAQLFRQWLLAKTDTPAERRTLLARPPIRLLVPTQTDLLLRGPSQSRTALTVEQKIENLYPRFTACEVVAFRRSLQAAGDPHAHLGALESELRTLKQTLETWRQSFLTAGSLKAPIRACRVLTGIINITAGASLRTAWWSVSNALPKCLASAASACRKATRWICPAS